MRAQPMLACESVTVSSAWYQQVLGLESAHGGDEYEMLTSEGSVVLQLHHADADEHPHLVRPGEPMGNGVAIWFETHEYASALDRILSATASVEILEADHVNPLANHREIWLHDPDGHLVVVSSPYGEV